MSMKMCPLGWQDQLPTDTSTHHQATVEVGAEVSRFKCCRVKWDFLFFYRGKWLFYFFCHIKKKLPGSLWLWSWKHTSAFDFACSFKNKMLICRFISRNMIMSISFQIRHLQFSYDHPTLPHGRPELCSFTLPLWLICTDSPDQSGWFPFISRLVWNAAR